MVGGDNELLVQKLLGIMVLSMISLKLPLDAQEDSFDHYGLKAPIGLDSDS